MGRQQTVIHINGKRYDAISGALLDDENTIVMPETKSKNIDGIVTSAAATPVIALAKPPVITEAIKKKPSMSDVVRTPAKHLSKREQQGSQTLMRHAVKKPGPSIKRTVKAQSHTDSLVAKPAVAVAPKTSVTALDRRRAQHAQSIAKSEHVKKFTPVEPHHNPAALAAVKQPAHRPAIAHSKPVATQQSRTTADILQKAIDQATSHEQTYDSPKKRSRFTGSRRVISFVMASAALVALAVTASISGLGAAKLHMASAKAGFDIAKPAYQPAGFSLGDLSSAPGSAGLHYQSNSDNRNFSIVEKLSQWDSTTLRDMVVKPSGSDYKTIESAGRTIYIDENHTANWVNGGIWYQVKNDSALSDHQLVQIANSL